MRLARSHESASSPPSWSRAARRDRGERANARGDRQTGVLLAQHFTQRGAVIVLQASDPRAARCGVVAVSDAAEDRLQGLVLPSARPRSGPSRPGAVGRAARTTCRQRAPRPPASGSRRHRLSTVRRPLRDRSPGGDGSPAPARTPRRPTSCSASSAELGSRLPAARAVFEAEQAGGERPATGLRNRRELERALTQHGSKAPPIATLISRPRSFQKAERLAGARRRGRGRYAHVARISSGGARQGPGGADRGARSRRVDAPTRPCVGLEVAAHPGHRRGHDVAVERGAVRPDDLVRRGRLSGHRTRRRGTWRGTADAPVRREAGGQESRGAAQEM